MIIDIPIEQGDDKQYLAGVCSLVASLVSLGHFDKLYVTRIKKRFDRKWLRYSGRG